MARTFFVGMAVYRHSGEIGVFSTATSLARDDKVHNGAHAAVSSDPLRAGLSIWEEITSRFNATGGYPLGTVEHHARCYTQDAPIFSLPASPATACRRGGPGSDAVCSNERKYPLDKPVALNAEVISNRS